MRSDVPAEELLTRWQRGDHQAAAELYHRYASRLIGLARSRLSSQLARRIDPEDVVQSVYRSFFAAARDGHYEVQNGDGLWHLLVTITLHKLHDQVDRLATRKRALERERTFGSEDSLFGIQGDLFTRDPSPAEAVALVEQLEQVRSWVKRTGAVKGPRAGLTGRRTSSPPSTGCLGSTRPPPWRTARVGRLSCWTTRSRLPSCFDGPLLLAERAAHLPTFPNPENQPC